MSRIQSPQKRKRTQIMRQLCHQRKTQNFQNLKKWDQIRASKLIIHRKIVDQIDQTLQTKLSQSNQYTKIVKQYFIDLLNQKNKYLSHHIQNPQSKLQTNPIGRHIYPTASRTLIKLFDATQNSKQFNLIKKTLQQSIQKIDEFLFDSQKQIMQLRTKIQLLVLQIQDCNMQTLQKCDTLVAIYNNSKNSKSLQSQQDFFMEQQSFLSQANKQLQCQKYLGNHIVEYLQFVQNKQIQKLQLLKKLIANYINILKLSHQGQQQHLINLYEILHKNTQNKYIDQYFSVQQLIPRQLIVQLARVQRKHQNQCLNIKYLKNFLKKFQYQQFDNRNLILKAIKVFIKSKPEKQSKQSQNIQSVQVYVTVDGFINIYHYQHQNTESDNQKPTKLLLYTLKISPSLSMKRINDLQLQINVKKWGLMTFSQNQQDHFSLLFNSQDQRQQFLQFITQLK